MTITMQQSRTTHANGADSLPLSFVSTPQAGCMIAVCIASYGGDLETGTVTDNQGNTYTRDYKLNDQMGDSIDLAIYTSYNVSSSGTFTVTVNPFGSNATLAFSIAEFRGVAKSSALDQSNTANGTVDPAPGVVQSGNITPTVNGEVVIGLMTFFTSGTYAITEDQEGEGFALIGEEENNATYQGGSWQYKVQTTAAQIDADWTLDAVSSWVAFIVSYKADTTLSISVSESVGVSDTPTLLPTVAFDAVSYDTTAVAGNAYAASGSRTWSHTCTGQNRALFVGVSVGKGYSGGDDTMVITSITYNGVSLGSPIVHRHPNDGTNGYLNLYCLVAPDAGTHDIVVNWTNSDPFDTDIVFGGAVSFVGVNQSTPDVVAHRVSAASTSTEVGVDVTSSPGNMVLDFIGNGSWVTHSHQTNRWLFNVASSTACSNAAMSTADGASTVNMSYTVGVDWSALLAVDVNAGGGGGQPGQDLNVNICPENNWVPGVRIYTP